MGGTMEQSSCEISGEPCAVKVASTVRRGAVGNTSYVVRWPPTLPPFPQ